MLSLNIRRNDMVKVLAGSDRGKSGRVLRVFPDKGTVLVEHVRVVKKTVSGNAAAGPPRGGIAEQELPINISQRGADLRELAIRPALDTRLRAPPSSGFARHVGPKLPTRIRGTLPAGRAHRAHVQTASPFRNNTRSLWRYSEDRKKRVKQRARLNNKEYQTGSQEGTRHRQWAMAVPKVAEDRDHHHLVWAKQRRTPSCWSSAGWRLDADYGNRSGGL